MKKVEISKETIKEIFEATDNNHHLYALKTLAKAAKHEKYAKILEAMIVIQDQEMHLSDELYNYYRNIYKDIKEYCKNALTKESFCAAMEAL